MSYAIVIYALLATAALSAMLVIAGINWRAFPRLNSHRGATFTDPAVSVLIPARNESAAIGTTVTNLLAQTAPFTELLVLDDDSSDDTALIAGRAANGDPRLTVLTGHPLPDGWTGKNWACSQLADAANRPVLVFTDAEVRWQPEALSAAMTMLTCESADLLTVWPTQVTLSWPERLVVPLMAFSVLAYLPAPLAHDTPYALAAAATGQCLIFHRRAYDLIGGHSAIRNQVLEDVCLAQEIKRHGLRLRMADANGLISCRMYSGWREVSNGYAKNILPGHGNSVLLLLLSTLFHIGLFVLPWIWLVAGLLWPVSTWPLWPLLLIAAGISARALTAFISHQRVFDALLMPISVLFMSAIAFQAIWWRYRYGGPRWKGRIVHTGRTAAVNGSRVDEPR